nr:putative phage-related protein tail component [uncultured Mediterranean phage uvMED]BAR25970.1 putative phage-related protein tail component [uncultured Mediterranean phage uvMED]BAR26007.1 putative phage-related protein tail component [uncultured Mediterranean phage uvMED]BAR26028.1 putative phage-related protein tail component [uncultured Mediterranean phage uvMED]BAR26071.1 putative phage-related protein tail component [uncultured Mediterranean phage uvMED]
MQLVMLAGELGEKYGTHHEYYNLQTPADAIKLLCINYPALKQEMVQAHHNGVGYKVIQGGAAMGYDELQLPFGSKPLLVVPVISGAGGGATTQILAGVGLVAASFLFPGAGLFGVTGLFGAGAAGVVGVSSSAVLTATAIGTGLSAVGASLILGGTASLISPQPQLGNLGANRIRGEGTNVRGPGPDGVTRGAMGHANYAFTGPANTVGTGATVPVIYGRVIAGSHLLAANLVVSDDSDPLKATTQAPGLQTFRINGDEVTRKLESHGGLQGRKLDDEIKGTNTDNRVLVNKVFGPSGDESLEEDKTLSNSQLKYKNDNRKKLDILFKIDKGLFDFVAGAGSTKLDGFIRYRITVELTGSGSDPTVASADVTVQGLLLQSNKILYGHRLEMPKVKDRDKVRVTVEIIDAEVHDGARLIFHAYGYDLL